MAEKAKSPDVSQMAEKIADYQQMGLKSMNLMGVDWVERMSDISAEMFGFMAERFKKDVELQHRLLHCKTPAELQKVQIDFFQTAIDRYTEETGRMMELGQKMFEPVKD